MIIYIYIYFHIADRFHALDMRYWLLQLEHIQVVYKAALFMNC